MLKDLLHVFVPDTHTLSNGKKVKEKFNNTPYIIIFLILLIVVCAVFTDVDFIKFFKRFTKGWTFVVRMLHPQWSYWDTAKQAMIDTIIISLVGTAFGSLIALPMSFYLSSNFKLNKAYLAVHRSFLSIFRTLPTLVYALLLSLVIGYGTTAGTLATAIFTYTVAVKMLYENIETVNMGAYEALESTGASRAKCMIKAIFPQIKAFYLSTVLYCFEMNIRSAAILGYVGAGGIGVRLNDTIGNMDYEKTGLLVLVLIIVVVIVETTSREIRKKLVNG
ncbi:MAG: phosphonate ABC transporter, permease protein PhnE [Erysipelotrichaceae bacterium]|nr:phosphonate ABC transporter, permease protein PhnE [Erysipelotrichaceae bacterium]